MNARDPPDGDADREIRVLYVEDNDETGPLVREWLERHDDRLDVSVAFSLDAGFDRLAESSFDAVMADYRFPDGTGLDLLGSARESDPELPFLLYSARVDSEVERAAAEAGATAVVEKGGSDQLDKLADLIVSGVESRTAPPEPAAADDPVVAFAAEAADDLRRPLSAARDHLERLDGDPDHAAELATALTDLEAVVDDLPERARAFDASEE